MRPLRWGLFLLLFAAAGGTLAQETRPEPLNEILLFAQHSHFTEADRSPHRTGTLQYYRAVTPSLKLFADASIVRKFDRTDASAGVGAYYTLNPSNAFYGFFAAGFNPAVIPRADLTVEYTRLLIHRLTGSLGYRYIGFAGEKVHMAVPGLTVYAIPRWTLTGKVFCARLGSDARLRATLFLHAAFDIDERWMPELFYTVGSEAYRATSLDLAASAHAWNCSIGGKVRLSDFLRLRVHAFHGVRAGAFSETGFDCALSLFW